MRLADGAAALHTDRCHSLGSLLPPPAALPSLPTSFACSVGIAAGCYSGDLWRKRQRSNKKHHPIGWCFLLAFFGAPAPKNCKLAALAIPTERSEGGRERGERRRGQEERPERVAAVGERGSRSVGNEVTGHRNSSRYGVILSVATPGDHRQGEGWHFVCSGL